MGRRDDHHWWSDDLRDLNDIYINNSITFDIFSHVMTLKKPAKKCAVCMFRVFLISIAIVVATRPLLALPLKQYS